MKKRHLLISLFMLLLIMPMVFSAEVSEGEIRYNPDNIEDFNSFIPSKFGTSRIVLEEIDEKPELILNRRYDTDKGYVKKEVVRIISGEVRWDTKEEHIEIKAEEGKKARILVKEKHGSFDATTPNKMIITVLTGIKNKGDLGLDINVNNDEDNTIVYKSDDLTYSLLCDEEDNFCSISLSPFLGPGFFIHADEGDTIPDGYSVDVGLEGMGAIKKDGKELKLGDVKNMEVYGGKGFKITAILFKAGSFIGDAEITSCIDSCSPMTYTQDGDEITIAGAQLKNFNCVEKAVYMPDSAQSVSIFRNLIEDYGVTFRGDSEIVCRSSGCGSLKKSCVSMGENEVEINPTYTGEISEESQGVINQVIYKPSKDQSLKVTKIQGKEYVLIEEEGGFGQMSIRRSEVNIAPSNVPWYKFGTSFTAEPYIPGKKKYGKLVCTLDAKGKGGKCTLDGKEISAPTDLGAKKCETNSDCKDPSTECTRDESIGVGFCTPRGKCEEIPGVPNSGKLEVLVLIPYKKQIKEKKISSSGLWGSSKEEYIEEKLPGFGEFAPSAETEEQVKRAINTLFKTKPYLNFKKKFRFVYARVEVDDMSEFKPGGVALVKTMKMRSEVCPTADLAVAYIDGIGGSTSLEHQRVAAVYKQQVGELLYNLPPWEPYTFVHELSHLFGLADEYTSTEDATESLAYKTGPNCVAPALGLSVEERAEIVFGPKVGSDAIKNKWYGCGGCGGVCKRFMRPSFNSIMRIQGSGTEKGTVFNAPSKQHLTGVLKNV